MKNVVEKLKMHQVIYTSFRVKRIHQEQEMKGDLRSLPLYIYFAAQTTHLSNISSENRGESKKREVDTTITKSGQASVAAALRIEKL
jgi:hypothetical protein